MIPFNKPYMSGCELANIGAAHDNGHLSGDGAFTRQCHEWLKRNTGAHTALLTHSCTAALEMAAILLDMQPGDEVIMPSYTFVSTANAFALRGARIVFVDIRADTLNIDETKIEEAITTRTKAICVVHYAGVSCDMDAIMGVAGRHGLKVVEDAAQGIMASYRGRPLGTIGDLGAFSFHETKNLIAGEGGALLCRDPAYSGRAEIVREKGTNRARFFRGQTDKYTWVDIGSSFLPGEIIAAFLAAQLDHADEITERRMAIWNRYHAAFDQLENKGLVRRPVIPTECIHNAHMYYLLLPDLASRSDFIARMKEKGVHTVFHYIPLHSAPAASAYSDPDRELPVTDDLSERLVRLPLWLGMEQQQDFICQTAIDIING